MCDAATASTSTTKPLHSISHQRHVYGQTDFFSGKTWRQFKYDVFLLLFSYLTSSLEHFQERKPLPAPHAANNNSNNDIFILTFSVCVYVLFLLLFSTFSYSSSPSYFLLGRVRRRLVVIRVRDGNDKKSAERKSEQHKCFVYFFFSWMLVGTTKRIY